VGRRQERLSVALALRDARYTTKWNHRGPVSDYPTYRAESQEAYVPNTRKGHFFSPACQLSTTVMGGAFPPPATLGIRNRCRRFSPVVARRTLSDMALVVAHFANAIGERAACASAA
jgi:hypothetical protein